MHSLVVVGIALRCGFHGAPIRVTRSRLGSGSYAVHGVRSVGRISFACDGSRTKNMSGRPVRKWSSRSRTNSRSRKCCYTPTRSSCNLNNCGSNCRCNCPLQYFASEESTVGTNLTTSGERTAPPPKRTRSQGRATVVTTCPVRGVGGGRGPSAICTHPIVPCGHQRPCMRIARRLVRVLRLL